MTSVRLTPCSSFRSLLTLRGTGSRQQSGAGSGSCNETLEHSSLRLQPLISSHDGDRGRGREAGRAAVAGGAIQWGGVLPASARGTPTAVRAGRHRVLCEVRRMDTDRGLRRVPRPGKKRCELDPRGRERMAPISATQTAARRRGRSVGRWIAPGRGGIGRASGERRAAPLLLSSVPASENTGIGRHLWRQRCVPGEREKLREREMDGWGSA